MGSKKHTYDFIKKQVEKEGFKFLSKEYINNSSKLKIQCNKDHIYETIWNSFQQGRRCPICSKRKKKTYDEVKNYIESFNYKLLSDKYISANNKLKLQCSKGHMYKVTWSNFNNGYRCPECAGLKRKTYEEVKEYIESFNYKLLSTKYINCRQKLKLQCLKDHIYYTTWDSFYTGHRCKKCADNLKILTYKEVKEYIEAFNYKLLSKRYNGVESKLKLQCPKDHIYKVTWHSFKRGLRCQECFFESQKKNYSEEDLKEFENYRFYITKLSNYSFNKYYYDINPKKLKRNLDNYHLDHIYSVADGFKYNIQPEVISNPNNLQMLWCKDNLIKHDKSDQTKVELYLGYYKFKGYNK